MEQPAFLLAPGAGASVSHPRMRQFAELLDAFGPVHAFDYPYMMEGRKRPDPLPRLIAAHRAAYEEVKSRERRPIVLIGKSMGSRVGCHLSLEVRSLALICLGYPLCGGGDRSKMRDAVLRELSTPVLFVQGTRDPLCPLDLLEQIRREMSAYSELHVVDGGDHSLQLAKTQIRRSGITQHASDQAIADAISAFLNRWADRRL